MKKTHTATFKAQMVREILKEEKTLVQIASENGIHPQQLTDWKATALRGLPSLFENERKTEAKIKAVYEQQQEELYAEIGRLTTQLAWLKKNLASSLSRTEPVALVEWEREEIALNQQAELLSLSRASLYYKPIEPSQAEIAIKHSIDELYTAHPFYGSRKITEVLKASGLIINRKAVQRHMREMGIAGICPGPNLSKRNQQHKIYPYLLRGLTISSPNHVWGIDITYVKLQTGWMYLVAIIDWFSPYVLSWELDSSLEMEFVLNAVERALQQAVPLIWNSDQGSHFTSDQYIKRLLAANVQISMDGKARAIDNIFTERLWRSLKYEDVYLKDYRNPREARHNIANYWHFYNHQRPHQSLDYKTPAQVYFQ